MKTEYLSISWAISRGKYTQGHNICRLDTPNGRYKCLGGGYDMIGTVVGDWLQATYLDRLTTIKDRFDPKHKGYLYGGRCYSDGEVQLDGACGYESMLTLAKAINVVLTSDSIKGRIKGIFVTEGPPYGSLEDLIDSLIAAAERVGASPDPRTDFGAKEQRSAKQELAEARAALLAHMGDEA
jgi:hypothetical protein